jgi:hypothetical protein
MIIVYLVLAASGPVFAQAPPVMPVQGTVQDIDGLPLNGNVHIRFALHTAEEGGEEVWFEDRTVACQEGFFTVYLGEETPLDLSEFASPGPLWLGLTVEGDPETNRLLLGTTGYAAFAEQAGEAAYAAQAGDAATVGGLDTGGLRTWAGLSGVPAGFADDVDNEGAPTTDAGQLVTGTLSTDRYSAYADLAAESRLDGLDDPDLLTRTQSDGRYVDEGQGSSITSGMVQDGVCLAELADDDGAGSGLDADSLDGRDSAQLRPLVASSTTAATTYLTTACLNYTNGQVTLTAPGPGTIVVEATAWMQLEHVQGTVDNLLLAIGSDATDCSDPYTNIRWDIPSGINSDSSIDQTFSMTRVFTVAAGTYTYYLNGYMLSGQSASDRFWFASMVARYYPD